MRRSFPKLGDFAAGTSDFRPDEFRPLSCDLTREPIPSRVCLDISIMHQWLSVPSDVPSQSMAISLPGHPTFDLASFDRRHVI